jgi:hypothetical protein
MLGVDRKRSGYSICAKEDVIVINSRCDGATGHEPPLLRNSPRQLALSACEGTVQFGHKEPGVDGLVKEAGVGR